MGTSGRGEEDEGHPALLSDFLPKGMALTLVFFLHTCGFHPPPPRCGLPAWNPPSFIFSKRLCLLSPAMLMVVLVTRGRLAKAQRPRVQLSQPEKQTQMLVPRQLSLGGEDQAECKSRRESPQEEVR